MYFDTLFVYLEIWENSANGLKYVKFPELLQEYYIQFSS